jgi:hypothetical protein
LCAYTFALAFRLLLTIVPSAGTRNTANRQRTNLAKRGETENTKKPSAVPLLFYGSLRESHDEHGQWGTRDLTSMCTHLIRRFVRIVGNLTILFLPVI